MMEMLLRKPRVLMADDDPDDCLLTEGAFRRSEALGKLGCVRDGDELLRAMRAGASRPVLVLLDLNMPRKGGFEVLQEIRLDPLLRDIPVVILSTSRDPADVLRAYKLGANSYITKPSDLKGYDNMVHALNQYWFDTVTLPHGHA